MTAQKTPRGLVFRWSTLKGVAALLLFIVSAALVEFLIVAYAVSIGVRDDTSFQIPWLGLTVSPLFHLIPTSTVIVLAVCWACMAEYVVTKPVGKVRQPPRRPKISGFLGKVKAGLLKVKGVAYVWGRLIFARATVKSAITILPVYLVLALLFSVLANPWLVYRSFANFYQDNPQILGFVVATNSALQGFIQAVAPIGWICSSISNAIKAAAPSIRDFASSLGALIKPLAYLPPVGKYLIFQNLAAWVSALIVLAYGAYMRKSYRYKRK